MGDYYTSGKTRNMKVTPDSGSDVRDTNVLNGTAKKTKAFQSTNETTEYETGSTNKGALGGMNNNS